MQQNISVEFQQTDGHAALDVPKERLEAIAHDVANIGIDEWGTENGTPRTVVLKNKWGDTDTNIMVRRLSAVKFHVVFMTRDEFQKSALALPRDQPQ